MKFLQNLREFLQRIVPIRKRTPDYARKDITADPSIPEVLRLLDTMGVDLETVGEIILNPVTRDPNIKPKDQLLDWAQGDLRGYAKDYHLPRLAALTKITLNLLDHPDFDNFDHQDYRERLQQVLLDDKPSTIMFCIQRGDFQEVDRLIEEINERSGRFALKDTPV